ncbi:methyl-accepting chemotaxis protein [Treponema sp.]|uniref:methyl-accepting chemotaxis protein n=1 Tax=Treponema sp. TaxID=166 RepID=UPI00298D9E83|nr:methyl-accepting chemotaxis protein [Treponema sp.]MCR5613769.1 methyl-accepting chemotaxis protein [Treponema sp.]
MSQNEKQNSKKSDSPKDTEFGMEIFKRLSIPVAVLEILTMTCCIAIAWGNQGIAKLSTVIILGAAICLGLVFILIGMVNSLVTQTMTEDLNSFYFYETTVKERTKLMKQLMMMPPRIGAVVFVVVIGCGSIWISMFASISELNLDSVILASTSLFIGTYFCVVYVITEVAQKICSKHASAIVKAGISKEEVEKRHYFGLTSTVITVFHIFAPILILGSFIFVLAWRTYTSYASTNIIFFRLMLVGVLSIVLYYFFSTSLFKRMMRSINNMRNLMSGINKENLHKVRASDTDLSNEFMFNVYLINTIVDILQQILRESQRISMSVVESSNELSVISRETAVTSLEQNSGVKELLSAMEESDALSKSIAEKIGEVSLVAGRTTDNINEGFDILKQNMQKLDEIKRANDVTVEGIKVLTEKVSGISDIARIINSIADQTNIIAFNAELEASSAGDVGENFALVANEIRRLTNNTIQSTEEIRKRIIEIQHSSDELLASSQNGSKKIRDGNQIINDLNSRFEELKSSSESMNYASEDIKKIIEQQTASFAQIVITLRQISEAAESFSGSTQKISDSAQNLCMISTNLKNLMPEDLDGDSDYDEQQQANVDAIVEAMSTASSSEVR